MKFYDRTLEVDTLRGIAQASATAAQMTIVIGRRRIGKTTLLRRAFAEGIPFLYFFVAKKNEVLLCDEFAREVREKLGLPIGSYSSFAELFKAIMQLSAHRNFTLVIDEFQEFRNINASVFSDMQNYWDAAKEESQINLVLCGSIYSMMKRIFENAKEPLFGRATAKLTVKPFATDTLKEILKEHHPGYTSEDLLTFYMITGGVAKYVEYLVGLNAFTKEDMLSAFFRDGSFFLDEGRAVLVDEFGRDYGNYYSILSLIASSKTDRGQLESMLNMDIGGYLERLEKEYDLVKRSRPFGAKEGSRFNKYKIEDNFLNFWFRFIYKYRSAIEIGNFDYVRNIVERDYDTYSGIVLEKCFRAKLIESKAFSDIQGYWNSKGENEIDIVAINEAEKRLVFYEVKRNPRRINLAALQAKAKDIVAKYPGFAVEYCGLSLEEM